jgi:hypothetical protein
LKTSFIAYLLKAENTAALVNEVLQLIQLVSDKVQRSAYLNELSALSKTPYNVLSQAIKKGAKVEETAKVEPSKVTPQYESEADLVRILVEYGHEPIVLSYILDNFHNDGMEVKNPTLAAIYFKYLDAVEAGQAPTASYIFEVGTQNERDLLSGLMTKWDSSYWDSVYYTESDFEVSVKSLHGIISRLKLNHVIERRQEIVNSIVEKCDFLQIKELDRLRMVLAEEIKIVIN